MTLSNTKEEALQLTLAMVSEKILSIEKATIMIKALFEKDQALTITPVTPYYTDTGNKNFGDLDKFRYDNINHVTCDTVKYDEFKTTSSQTSDNKEGYTTCCTKPNFEL